MLRRPEGATIAEVVAATSWQPHTVRGALAGALKKRLGLEVISEKVEAGDRVYRFQPRHRHEAQPPGRPDLPRPRVGRNGAGA